MLTASVQSFIEQLLNEKCTFIAVGGGSINHTYRIAAGQETFFCKINSLSSFPALFDTEQKGLQLLAQQQVIRIPKVIATAHTGDSQILLLEWIEQGLKTDTFWSKFGEQLAALHHITGNQFGLDSNNYMGALPQNNTPDN